jgi:hypothetical protein
MKTLVVVAALGFLAALPAKADLISTFDSGAEGWNAIDRTGDYTSTWQSAGGNPGGYLLGSETDPLGGPAIFMRRQAGWAI